MIANHDIAYEDESGFFSWSQSSSTIPESEDNGFWDDLEDFFSWFDPANWLVDIGDIVEEGLGFLQSQLRS